MLVRLTLTLLFLHTVFIGFTQSNTDPIVRMNTSFKIIEPIRNQVPIAPEKRTKPISNQRNKKKAVHKNQHALPIGNDLITQQHQGFRSGRQIIENWEGLDINESGGAGVPDPSGAVSDSFYVEMTNVAWQVFDRQGNALTQPQSLSMLFPGASNAGDPIVMFDAHADRWFVSQFQMDNSILISISQTSDPLGGWYEYSFSNSVFPDYPKYSIWSDGYYMTSNTSGENAIVFERDKMIAGDPSARQIQLNLPSLNTGGFYSPLSADADGSLPAVGTPCPFVYYQDDGWGAGTDNLTIWDFNTDWTNTGNTNITINKVIQTTPFNSDLGPGFNSSTQPGTNQRIDAIEGALMYRLQHRDFGSHRSMVGNFAVNVDNNEHIGIRWFELRDNNDGNGWVLYQEGTYAPDSDNRFMGSISMDKSGNIGMGFSVSSSTTYPSIRYTGRFASDPLGTMTFAETTIVDGQGVATWSNRFGDYAHMVMDPVNDNTFWYVGEYFTSDDNWTTQITAFEIGSEFPNDIGVINITNPVSGSTMSNAETITIDIRNFGTNDQTNFNVAYQIDGGTPVIETYSNTLKSGTTDTYSFSQTANLSANKTYTIRAYTDLVSDSLPMNDDHEIKVDHPYGNDVGVSKIISPLSGINLSSTETVSVEVTNYGLNAQTNVPIAYVTNGGNKISETISSVGAGATVTYNFSTPINLSVVGKYEIEAFTELVTDQKKSNDTTLKAVFHHNCTPSSDCSFGAGFVNFELFQISNTSGCEGTGYSDFTNLSTRLLVDSTYSIIIAAALTADHNFSMWIDYDDNLVFDSTEVVFLDTLIDYMDTLQMTVPGDAPFGYHLMRVRNTVLSGGTDACLDVQYGETEDYSVLISNMLNIDQLFENNNDLVFVKDNGSSGWLQLPSVKSDFPYEMHILNSAGQEVIRMNTVDLSNNRKQKIDLSDLKSGVYIIQLFNIEKSYTRKFSLE